MAADLSRTRRAGSLAWLLSEFSACALIFVSARISMVQVLVRVAFRCHLWNAGCLRKLSDTPRNEFAFNG
jgi:hypothetical protein